MQPGCFSYHDLLCFIFFIIIFLLGFKCFLWHGDSCEIRERARSASGSDVLMEKCKKTRLRSRSLLGPKADRGRPRSAFKAAAKAESQRSLCSCPSVRPQGAEEGSQLSPLLCSSLLRCWVWALCPRFPPKSCVPPALPTPAGCQDPPLSPWVPSPALSQPRDSLYRPQIHPFPFGVPRAKLRPSAPTARRGQRGVTTVSPTPQPSCLISGGCQEQIWGLGSYRGHPGP